MTEVIESLIKNNITNSPLLRTQLESFFLDYYQTDSLENAFILSGISKDTIIISFFAGAGERWIKSIPLVPQYNINPNLPRSLAKVENILDSKYNPFIPIGFYNLHAVKDLGRQIVLCNNGLDKLKSDIFVPLQITPLVLSQSLLSGRSKVAGHGDAIRQIKNHLINSKYIITNFSNDANSRKTILLSLLTLHYYNTHHINTSVLIPCAYMNNPKYPIYINEYNLPTHLSHHKLKGDSSDSGLGYSNIGVRVYSTFHLLKILDDVELVLSQTGNYASFNNGNDEFALDNIDEIMMLKQTAKILPLSSSDEIIPAKIATKIPEFLSAMQRILDGDQ